jgi:hypothetical protein
VIAHQHDAAVRVGRNDLVELLENQAVQALDLLGVSSNARLEVEVEVFEERPTPSGFVPLIAAGVEHKRRMRKRDMGPDQLRLLAAEASLTSSARFVTIWIAVVVSGRLTDDFSREASGASSPRYHAVDPTIPRRMQ